MNKPEFDDHRLEDDEDDLAPEGVATDGDTHCQEYDFSFVVFIVLMYSFALFGAVLKWGITGIGWIGYRFYHLCRH